MMNKFIVSKVRPIKPCNYCKKEIELGETVYCPECGDPYHQVCWEGSGNRCIVYKCSGSTRKPGRLEIIFTQILASNKKDLSDSCSNCSGAVSILSRYCHKCGNEVNPIQKQRAVPLFQTAKRIQKNAERFMFGVRLCIYSLVGLLIWSMYVNIKNVPVTPTATSEATVNAINPSMTPRPTITETVIPQV